MKVSKFLNSGFIALVLLCGSTNFAHSALNDNGDGTVTQTRSDGSELMWLQDANYARTVGYGTDVNARMTWAEALGWIDYLNDNTYLGYNDWRLPQVAPPNGEFDYTWSTDGTTDNGHNIDSLASEFGYLFAAELGNASYYAPDGSAPQVGWSRWDFNVGSFSNLMPWHYWTQTEYPENSNFAFHYYFQYGSQGAGYNKDTLMYTWAVRSVVPEPISSTLFIVGGATLGFRRFLKKRRTV